MTAECFSDHEISNDKLQRCNQRTLLDHVSGSIDPEIRSAKSETHHSKRSSICSRVFSWNEALFVIISGRGILVGVRLRIPVDAEYIACWLSKLVVLAHFYTDGSAIPLWYVPAEIPVVTSNTRPSDEPYLADFCDLLHVCSILVHLWYCGTRTANKWDCCRKHQSGSTIWILNSGSTICSQSNCLIYSWLAIILNFCWVEKWTVSLLADRDIATTWCRVIAPSMSPTPGFSNPKVIYRNILAQVNKII